ncbi:MAG: MFS transporter [Chloroflexi bacterium]|nr:MFS transporter [Chloroflexota bacterium]
MAAKSELLTRAGTRDHIAAGAVIVSHSLQHIYGNAFYVILPVMYTALGLSPVAAGLMGTARTTATGTAALFGGILVDRLQHRRLLILYISLFTVGFGYLLVGLAPAYVLILIALALASLAGSVWHPVSRGLLSQIYPDRRGFMISLDRSVGNLGDTIGPLAAGGLLMVTVWQQIFFGALPIAMAFGLLLWITLRGASTWQELGAKRREETRPLREQLHTLADVFRSNRGSLSFILLVAGLSGMGQGGIMLWVPLYLQEAQGLDSVSIGFHVALLAGMGIATGPIFGLVSDRLGRIPVIVVVLGGKATMAALLAMFGAGTVLTILVAGLGAFLFGVNPLIQAWALDIVEGRKLEGTMLGMLWGNNAIFQGGAPLLIGFVVAALGFGALFWYIAALNTLAILLVAILIPTVGRRSKLVSGD